jgi:hypothetical protein
MNRGLLKYFFFCLTTDNVITFGTWIDFVAIYDLSHDVSRLSLDLLRMIPYSPTRGMGTISIPISLDLFLLQAAAMD